MKFNQSQTRAILHKDGPMLVLAGPGSGKTAVITARTKNLIQEYQINPSNILVITFTKAAAMEMKQRFETTMNSKDLKVTFGTFHAIFFMVLKLAYGYTRENIVSEEIKYQLVKELIYRYNLEFRDENECISGILEEISKIKNSKISLEFFYSNQCSAEVFREIYSAYNQSLRMRKLIDFDDMLVMTYELFAQRKDILAAWQNKYKYILVDEFQDINQIQYDIIRMMALPNNHLFMVGDDDQSIYGFRGSKSEIMLHVPEDFPNLTKVELDVNYRCHPEILKLSQALISCNKTRFLKKCNSGFLGNRGYVDFQEFETQKEEVLFVLKYIENKVHNGAELKDIAILFRTNKQPRFLMEQLMAYNVDFKMKDNIPNIYEHWIAKDLFAYMNLARGSRKRQDVLMVMNKPKRYLSREGLTDSYVCFSEWEKLYDEQPWIGERIEKLEYDLNLLSKMNPYAAINYIRHGIGYEEYLDDYANYRNISKEDLYDILDELQTSAKGFKNYEAFELHIEEYAEELKRKKKEKNQNSNAVTLATLHSAKGLEFQFVLILDTVEGIMPYKKAVLDHEIEEERRLFYVGMTRAKEELTLCSVKSVHNKSVLTSRFISEAGINHQ